VTAVAVRELTEAFRRPDNAALCGALTSTTIVSDVDDGRAEP
jgi:hypothetical protein